MKRTLASFAAASVLALCGCADQLEQPTTQEVGERFQRGISGEGKVVPRDRSDDPYVRSDEPGAAPETRPLPEATPQSSPEL